MMSSVETDATSSTAAAAGQKRLWSENQSDIGGCEEASPAEESSAAGKYHRDGENSADAGHSADQRTGTQVTSLEECPPEMRREEINGKRSSSTPSADTASPSADAGIPISAHAITKTEAASADEPILLRRVPEQEEDGDRKAASALEENQQSSVDRSDSELRRAFWNQHNTHDYEKMMASAGGETFNNNNGTSQMEATREQRQQSRSSTPSSSSRNMSPSDIYRRSYQQYGAPFSSSVSVPVFAGTNQRQPFLPAAPAVGGRHHAPFPFFANPFMVPFAPHLPQANVSEQSPSNEKCTPEEWNSNMAGVRRNPDSGGFYLHPQYYHELLQQYLRNMAITDAGTEEANVHVPGSNEEGNAKISTNSSYENVSHGLPDHEQRPDSAPSDSQQAISASGLAHLSREAVRQRLAGQNETSSGDWHSGAAESGTDMERRSAEISTMSNSNDASIETSTEASPLKISRPGTLSLDDGSAKDEASELEGEQSGRSGTDADNPAMVLIKKQISEIEKQILRKAQNQNIRKMDAKEIEAFLLMEQQRTLEANLFDSNTNTSAWAQTALPWLQNDAMHWDRAGAVADAIARQQFEPVPDQRSLLELAAAAAAVNDPTTASVSQLNQPSGFVQAHFPQATSAFVPPPQSIYPSAVPWPPAAPFYPPGTASSFGFPGASGYFPPPAGVYGGTVPHQYMANTQPYPSAAVPPLGVLPPFANGPPHPQLQQQRLLEQESVIRFNNALKMAQRTGSDNGVQRMDNANLPVASQSGFIGDMDTNPSSIDSGPWRDSNDERYAGDQIQEDEPVWVLRESYVRKLKREEERLAQKERDAASQPPNDVTEKAPADSDAYNETDKLLDAQRSDSAVQPQDDASLHESAQQAQKAKKKKEVMVHEPAVLIEGVLFRARYLGSTQLVCDGRPTKATRMMQAQEAVSRIKAPDGEPQPSTDVDLFISTEKIMVLNTDLQRISETDVRQDIMMDHPLRTISYIADIGELVVLMARRVSQSSPESPEPAISRTPKIICHVFESEEAQFIAQSIGQAFQVAYMEFLRANGIDDPGYLRDVDYQEVLNSQEIFGEELEMFARKETQKDVVVPKQKNEILGVVIVESGWGSMLPTVVIANLMPAGPAARSNNLNIGDHIIALNGISFVGLPLSACQNHIRNVRHLTAVKLTVVHTPPVVEVRIKRPDTKYQLGFSVQNGVICSLLRGGIAERGGVRVGHRIIEINSQSVVAVPHEKIVTMLATAVGEIQMKTMPTSMFRLLTGQETPNYI